MRGREEFGKYLLLKKLGEDPLGETFRAGRVAGGSVEQVVLLRVFNGRELDGGQLWQRISGLGDVQAALRNPNIGTGVDLGEERGIPYVAYDYVSGRNLESLLIQTSNTNTPMPMDHSLLVAERMALALAAAAETRGPEGHIHHGFAVPHLVMVSNEGETRVLGFEAAPGLAAQAGSLGGEITRYLAPELVAEQAAHPSDDVYTLGAVLWELMACKPLPTVADGQHAATIDNAQVAYDGNPIPADVAMLLKRSLAPRSQRLGNAAAWHKALSQLMANAGHTATTFNLAFFMHNLFRKEIEQENREIEEEKNIAVAAPAAAMAATAAAGEDAVPVVSGEGAADETTSSGPGKGLILGIAAVLLLAVLAAGWYFMNQRQAAEAEAEAATAAAAEQQAVEEAAEVPAGPTPEEIQAQISSMLDERSEQMEEKLGTQYDNQLQELQAQLAQAKAAAAAAEQERQGQVEEEERLAAEEAQRLADEEAQRLAAAAAATKKAEEDAAAKEAQRLAEEQAAQEEQQAAAAPVKPKTKEGDLVGMGSGVTPPELIAAPQVRYPAMARKLAKEADVEVRVLVDERGAVREVEPIGKKAGFGFDGAALDAARSAKYRPAQKDGVRVKMYINLTIKFNL